MKLDKIFEVLNSRIERLQEFIDIVNNAKYQLNNAVIFDNKGVKHIERVYLLEYMLDKLEGIDDILYEFLEYDIDEINSIIQNKRE